MMIEIKDLKTYRMYLKGLKKSFKVFDDPYKIINSVVHAELEPWYEGMEWQSHSIKLYNGNIFNFKTNLIYDEVD